MLSQQPSLQLVRSPTEGWHYLAKAACDRSLALVGLVFALPLLALIATAILLTSKGPVLYRQRRLGFNEAPFDVYKFRSMYIDLCDAPEATEVRQAKQGDPRITPLGRILRRTSMDELPQLINVLKGDMSLVGPRPHAIAHDRYYSRIIDGYAARYRVKPGLTGWAQVNGYRGETDTVEKMTARIRFDLYYIEHWSLLLDAKILLISLMSGFIHKEAR